jgi:hypothetical protein
VVSSVGTSTSSPGGTCARTAVASIRPKGHNDHEAREQTRW